ncbi:hypothetical protein [Lederbergia citrea]|uniref:non-homologous end-joining DNA ligase LigD n=1 Tax=Lederbergia citrea TaxID=2833581 RepID=UPI003D2CFA31
MSRNFYKNKERMLLNDIATLVWAANYSEIEFHVPFDRHDKPDFPMEMVFDLDPPDDTSFNLVIVGVVETEGSSSIPRSIICTKNIRFIRASSICTNRTDLYF